MNVFQKDGSGPQGTGDLSYDEISYSGSSAGSGDEVEDYANAKSRFARKKKSPQSKSSNIVYNRFPKLVSIDEKSHIAGGDEKDIINQDGYGNPFSQMISLKQLV